MRVFFALGALVGVVALSLVAMFVCGCTVPLEHPAATPSAVCQSLDRDHRTWGAVAKFSGALAGSGALATLPIPPEEKTARITVGVSAAALGALAAAAVYVEQDAASSWARDCAVARP